MKEVTIEELRPLFRIITNGLKFRVQRLEWRGILWWRKHKWITITDLYYDTTFPTIRIAQAFMDDKITELKAKINGWRPINSYTE